jgi:hypothetical protein
MSDNVFAFNKKDGKVRWGSFDVSKMEGSHDETDIQQIINLTYSAFDGDSELISTLKDITLVSSIHSPALYGNYTFIVPYLSSGCPGTADYNCFKMSKAVSLLWRIISDVPLTNEDDEAVYQSRFKIPVTDLVMDIHNGKLKDVFKFFGMTLESVCVIPDVIALDEKSNTVELDLLGYCAVKVRLDSETMVYIPALSHPIEAAHKKLYLITPDIDRLGRSIVMFKDRDDDGSD